MLDILKKEEAVGFAHVITGDESWFLYNYPFKTFWGKASDSAPKITHPDISSEKSMLVVFWGVATTPILTFLPRGLSVNAALFQELVVKPLSKINSSLPKGENLLIHWDNAPAHRATTTTSLIEKRKLTLIPQPPYSPDLAPSDFFLFGYIKGQLRGKGFKTLIDLEQEIKSIMERITPVTRIRVFQHWIWRLEAVIASEGEYYDAC
jgi:histone-lysine N-methyltransferase SETMAR